ncbi:MAG TPA: TonB-dependent receptor [Pyrinomonadaceae bacterium]|nr:TonB-dependent receptor [Pyrinomonadaceae bacterium]
MTESTSYRSSFNRPGKPTRFKCYVATFVVTASLVAVALASLATIAMAQQPQDDLTTRSIEDLMNMEVASVYSASKYSQKVTEAPSSVSIVTSEQIQRYGYRTLGEILSSVRGFYVTSDRNYTYVGVRGFARPGDYNTRILLLVDGHRLNDNIYDQGFLGRELPVDVDLIERVEIVRGPSSSLYGTNAFFAVVNVITKRGQDVDGIEISTEVASFGSYQGRLSYGKKMSNKSEILLSGTHYDSRGQRQLYIKEFDSPATNNGVAVNADDEKATNLLVNVSFKDFTLHGTYGVREKGIPTGAFGTIFNDRRTRTNDRRGYVDLKYDHTFSNQLNLVARASYDSYAYNGDYIYDYSEDDTPLLAVNKDSLQGRWWTGELQLTKTIRKHRLTVGSEYRDNVRQNQSNFNLGSEETPFLDLQQTSRNVAVFLQDEFRMGENLTLTAGARYDRHSEFGGTIKPRLALIYHPVATATVKLLYGEAFRAPNNYELYYGAAEGFNGNPTLKPETISTTELVFEKYLGDHMRLSASGYVYRIKGLISQTADSEGSITFSNQEEVAARGLELELESKLAGGFEGSVAYTLQQTRDQETGQGLSNSPRHVGKFNLTAPLVRRRLFAAFQFQYASQKGTLNGSFLPASYVSNFTLSSPKLAKGLGFSFGAYNLFDHKYADPGSEEHVQNAIEQNGRNLRLKFTYHF